VSRLARSNADWYQLLDLCALTDTLIADADGIYQPGSYNDRLVRHEVLRDRTEVKDHRRRAIAVVR
jgi:DNA invertase Pin-like site-specific DNA recombinase